VINDNVKTDINDEGGDCMVKTGKTDLKSKCGGFAYLLAKPTLLPMAGLLIGLLGLAFQPTDSMASSRMVLLSKDFKNHGTIKNEQVFSSFGCSGKNISPELHWKGVPKGTKSLALTAYDPDAPTGSGWWHWVLIDLPANTTHLAKNAGTFDGGALPKGSFQAVTDFGKKGYGGPCPPVGDRPHHYIFTLYALKAPKLDVPEKASPALIGYFIHQTMIKKATLVGLYGRSKHKKH